MVLEYTYCSWESAGKVSTARQELRSAKIYELDLDLVVLYLHHYIVRLDISVKNIPGMDVTNSREKLSHDLGYGKLWENIAIVENVRVKGSSSNETDLWIILLCDQNNAPPQWEIFMDFQDVGMIQLF